MNRIRESVIAGIVFLLAVTNGLAQTSVETMYLEISQNKTTNLIYPYPIVSVDKGSMDILAQKANNVENVLQLKAGSPDFKETNLTVITADGRLYSYLLLYREDPVTLNINYKGADAAGSLAFLTGGRNESVLKETAGKIALKKRSVSGLDKKSYGMLLTLEGIYVNQDVFFFQLKLENTSDINFDTEELRFFIRDNKKSKRTATQELEITPVYTFGDPSKVPERSSLPLVFALPKFTIPNDKHLLIQLFEKNGGRHLELKIKNRKLIKSVSSQF